MSQGFAGLGWNRSKMPKSPPIVQLHVQNTDSAWPSPYTKQKQEQDTDSSQSLSVWHRFSSCKWFLFIEERAHPDPRKMKRMDSTGRASPALLPLDLSAWGQFTPECDHSDTWERTQHRGVTCAKDRAGSEGREPFTHGPWLSSPSSLPSAHSSCRGGTAELVLVLIWGGLFCFIFSNSLCKMFPNKLFLYYLLAAICEHTGRAWCINVGIHSSPPAGSEILPNTHTEGRWLLRLCSTFTALAVLKFN